MKLGICTKALVRKLEDEIPAIKRFADAGFTAMDYNYDGNGVHDGEDSIYLKDGWKEYAMKVRKAADEAGMIFSQVHAPAISYMDSEDTLARKIELTKRAFRVSEILGAPYMVIHPRMFADGINGEHGEEYLALNVEFYKEFLPYAEKTGVSIALENMFDWDPKVQRLCRTTFSTMEEMLECKRRLNSDLVVICLDTGHSNIHRESPALAAGKLGSNLKCLHVHDNWGIADYHLACGYGNIEWDPFIEKLKEIGFNGCFSSEAAGMVQRAAEDAKDMALRLIAENNRALLEKHGIQVE